ncbi:MAG: hypothetical protein ACREJ0_22605 [Geminicoccaceae bacterium]
MQATAGTKELLCRHHRPATRVILFGSSHRNQQVSRRLISSSLIAAHPGAWGDEERDEASTAKGLGEGSDRMLPVVILLFSG